MQLILVETGFATAHLRVTSRFVTSPYKKIGFLLYREGKNNLFAKNAFF